MWHCFAFLVLEILKFCTLLCKFPLSPSFNNFWVCIKECNYWVLFLEKPTVFHAVWAILQTPAVCTDCNIERWEQEIHVLLMTLGCKSSVFSLKYNVSQGVFHKCLLLCLVRSFKTIIFGIKKLGLHHMFFSSIEIVIWTFSCFINTW